MIQNCLRALNNGVAFALLVSPALAVAESDHEISAETLQTWCKPLAQAKVENRSLSYSRTTETERCFGAFAAIQQLVRLQWEGEKHPALEACPPPESTLTQVVKVFLSYVDRHPDELHRPGALVARDAIGEAFPCNKAP